MILTAILTYPRTGVQRNSLVVVVREAREGKKRLLRNREQPQLLAGDRHALDRVQVDHALRVVACLVRDLGDKYSMILRNHGLLTCAETVADAFLFMYILQKACEVQVRAQSGGAELVKIAQPILDGIGKASKAVLRQSGGMIAWPGILRRLDRSDPSWRT